MSSRVGREVFRTGIVAALFAITTVFISPALAQDANGSSGSGSSEVPIRGTEKFYSAKTQQLEDQIAADETNYQDLDEQIKEAKSSSAANSQQIVDLEKVQNQTYREWGRLEEDLDRAKLESIKDAPEGSSTQEQLTAEQEKRDALEALKDWSAQYVGITQQAHVDVQNQLKATEDSIKDLEDKAAAEKQNQGETGSGRDSGSSGSGSGAKYSSPSGSSDSPSTEGGGGGVSLLPLVLGLLLLGGVVYGVAAGGSGLAGRMRVLVGTPLAGGRGARSPAGVTTAPPPPPAGAGSFADEGPGPSSGPNPRTDGGGGVPPGEGGPGPGGSADGGGSPEGSAGSPGTEDPDDWPDEDYSGTADGSATRDCPGCGAQVSSTAKYCRECGRPIR